MLFHDLTMMLTVTDSSSTRSLWGP